MKIGTDKNSGTGTTLLNRELLLTEGIRSFLLRRGRGQTLQWLDMVYSVIPELNERYTSVPCVKWLCSCWTHDSHLLRPYLKHRFGSTSECE